MGSQTYLPVEILDYVQTHAPPEDSLYGVSQRELARALGYHPCSMSRPLDALVEQGLLKSARRLVREGVRRQLTYTLTDSGRSRLRRETREVPILSGETPPPPHPFLGRNSELAGLGDFVRGKGGVVFVDGPPGMGKTALLSRHLRATRRGAFPFWFTVRASSTPRQFVGALAHSLQVLRAHQLAYYAELPRPPTPKEVADLTTRALGQTQLVAVVDDAHLAGAELRRFLKEFIVGLFRGGDHRVYVASQEPPMFETEGLRTFRLTVGGLERSAAHELTDRLGGLSERFESVYQSTLGSPLLLQLAVRNPDVSGPASGLPEAVLRRLDPREFEAILPVAVANEPLPLSVVTEGGEVDAGRIQDLVRMGLLHRTPQGQVEVLQVVRVAILSQLRPGQERAAHLRLAVYYSRSHRADSIRQRFLHLVEAEGWKTAFQVLGQQEKALLSLGYSEPVRNAFRRLSNALPKGPTRLRVLRSEVKLLRQHSNYAEALSALRRVASESAGDPGVTCETRLAAVDLLLRLRQLPEADAEMAQALQLGPHTTRLQAFATLERGRLAESKGDKRGAQELYQQAFSYARAHRVTDLALESIAAWTSLSELYGGGHETTLQVVEEALPSARAEGRVDIVFNLSLVRSHAYSMLGRVDLAEQEIQAVRSEAEALGYVNQLAYALSGLAAMANEQRRFTDAANYAKQAISLSERLGNELVLGHTLAQLCTAEFRMADTGGDRSLLDDASVHGERSVEVLSRLPHSDSLAFAHGYLAEVYSYKNDQRRAGSHFRDALDVATELGLGWFGDSLRQQLPALAKEATAVDASS